MAPPPVLGAARQGRSTRTGGVVLVVLAAGLLTRLGAAGWFPVVPAHDAADYEALGASLARGEGYTNTRGEPETFRPPLYPAFIAGIYAVTGRSPMAVRVAQAWLDLATCALLWWWALQRLGSRAATATLVLAAISWSGIGSVRVLLSECLAAFLLTAAIVLFDLNRARRLGSWALGLSGIAVGLAILTRAILLLIPALLAGSILMERIRWRQRAGALAFLLCACVLVLVPWSGRNLRVTGAPTLTTQLGQSFYTSQFRNPEAPYGVMTHDAFTEASAHLPAAERSAVLTRETLRRLRERPAHAFVTYPEKLLSLWVPLDWEVIGNRTWNIPYLLTVLLACLGGWRLWPTHRSLVVHAWLPLAYMTLIAFPFYGSPRMRLPAEPVLAPLAAWGWLIVRERVLKRRGAVQCG